MIILSFPKIKKKLIVIKERKKPSIFATICIIFIILGTYIMFLLAIREFWYIPIINRVNDFIPRANEMDEKRKIDLPC